jgi:putative transcriptional regulator
MENKIRYYRFITGEMTQQQLAEKAGVSRQTIIAIEKGAFNPSVKLALKLSKILNTTVESLFYLEKKDY